MHVIESMTLGRPVHRFAEVTSTNEVALELYRQGAPSGTLVVADAQTRGRGRRGREWVSPPGGNLYCSYIVRAGNSEWISWIPLIASLAVTSAIHAETAVNARVKWPNDVLIEGRKVAGVLAEAVSDHTDVRCVILGLGVNVNMPVASLPSALQSTVTSLCEHVDDLIDRNLFLTRLTHELNICYQMLWNGDMSDIVSAYLKNSETIGRKIIAYFPLGGCAEGWVDGIESDGSLRLRRSQGEMVILRSADIVHVR